MMGISRDAVEGLVSESEIEHRYAHALLRPANLYYLYEESEVKKLSLVCWLKFIPTGHKAPKKAKFSLVKLQGTTPPCWIYKLTEIE